MDHLFPLRSTLQQNIHYGRFAMIVEKQLRFLRTYWRRFDGAYSKLIFAPTGIPGLVA